MYYLNRKNPRYKYRIPYIVLYPILLYNLYTLMLYSTIYTLLLYILFYPIYSTI